MLKSNELNRQEVSHNLLCSFSFKATALHIIVQCTQVHQNYPIWNALVGLIWLSNEGKYVYITLVWASLHQLAQYTEFKGHISNRLMHGSCLCQNSLQDSFWKGRKMLVTKNFSYYLLSTHGIKVSFLVCNLKVVPGRSFFSPWLQHEWDMCQAKLSLRVSVSPWLIQQSTLS